MPRARVAEAVRPPCPQGHTGAIWLSGTYARTGDAHRTLYACRPTDAAITPHRFAAPLPARRAGAPGAETDALTRRGDGARTGSNFTYSIDAIANLLASVGEGVSVHQASRSLRLEAGRVVQVAFGLREESRARALGLRYVDRFAPTIERALAPTEWPPIVTLDALPFRERTRDRESGVVTGSSPYLVLLAASGKTSPDAARARLWQIKVAGAGDTAAWEQFLRSLPGKPRWVVADADPAIAKAVKRVWDLDIYPCEHHTAANLADAAERSGVVAVNEPLIETVRHALRGPREWAAYVRTVPEKSPLTTAVRRVDPLLARAFARRSKVGRGYPRSTGALESELANVRKLFEGRTQVFGNRRRLDLILSLMRLRALGQADRSRYARIIATALSDPSFERGAGAWEAGADPKDHPSLRVLAGIDKSRSKKSVREVFRDGQRASVERKTARRNTERAARGLPPLALGERTGGGAINSIPVAGLGLGDFPEITREWDERRNGVEARWISAGSSRKAHWVCAIDPNHRWEASVSDRTKRGTGCPRCARLKKAGPDTLAKVAPKLVRAWVIAENGGLLADEIGANSKRMATWRCSARKGHPRYQRTVRAQVAGGRGCPRCAA